MSDRMLYTLGVFLAVFVSGVLIVCALTYGIDLFGNSTTTAVVWGVLYLSGVFAACCYQLCKRNGEHSADPTKQHEKDADASKGGE